MIPPSTRLPLAALDRAILYLDRRNQPLHLGCMVLLAPLPDAIADVVPRRRERLCPALPLPPFKRRLECRFGGTWWVEDAGLDGDQHLIHLKLPPPGRRQDQAAVAPAHPASRSLISAVADVSDRGTGRRAVLVLRRAGCLARSTADCPGADDRAMPRPGFGVESRPSAGQSGHRPRRSGRAAALHRAFAGVQPGSRYGLERRRIAGLYAADPGPRPVEPCGSIRPAASCRSTWRSEVSDPEPGIGQKYWEGCRLDGLHPVPALMDAAALGIGFAGRGEYLDFGQLVCFRTLPRGQRLPILLEDALETLESRIHRGPTEPPKRGSAMPAPRPAAWQFRPDAAIRA